MLRTANNKGDVLDILDFISNNLNGSAKVKMDSCLHKNIVLEAIIMLNKSLYYGSSLSFSTLFSDAVERTFSHYKYILTCRKQKFNFEDLEKILFILFCKTKMFQDLHVIIK